MKSKVAASARRRSIIAWMASWSALVVLAGCGGGNGYGGGSVSNNAPVAPTITTPPANVTVAAGQPATFSVVADGFTPLSYQWSRDNTMINGATQASYTLAAATAADNGATFQVKVMNIYGMVTSGPAMLTVQ
jgi:hypothetical protein